MSAGNNPPAKPRTAELPPEGKPSPLSSDPEVRMDKVEKIRRAVQRGAYKVPASKVAAKILDEMRRK